jgi:transcriptional regulator with XRE-family HTH domain
MTFSGSKLREIREAAGRSREDLAAHLRTSSATIGNWERGVHVPDANDTRALADYFGIGMDALYETAA